MYTVRPTQLKSPLHYKANCSVDTGILEHGAELPPPGGYVTCWNGPPVFSTQEVGAWEHGVPDSLENIR